MRLVIPLNIRDCSPLQPLAIFILARLIHKYVSQRSSYYDYANNSKIYVIDK